MPKVSVIVPIYGVEQFIERCARSLFEQTLNDMEFIFVNDATTDNSMTILEEVIKDYPTRKGQIKILSHSQNKGLSFARETGVKAASGDYIAHCDSDDWVERNMYQMLYNHAVNTNSDFVKCGHFESDGINNKIINVRSSENDTKEIIINRLISCQGWNSVWDTIVSRKIYLDHNIVFTNDAMLEDFLLSVQILSYCKTITCINEPYYYYFKNPNSICNKTSDSSIINRSLQATRNVKWILDFVHNNFGKTYNAEEVMLKYVPRRILIPAMCNYSNYKIWNRIYPGNSIKILKSKYISRKRKLQYLMVVLRFYPIYNFLFKK